MSPQELFILVDENDNIIGSLPRSNMGPGKIHRVSALWVTNSEGDILLAQRSKNKKFNPRLWGPAVAGTVEVGETYESNIIKKAEEEIGLIGVGFQENIKVNRTDHIEKPFFCQWFLANVDREISEFRIQENEVEELRWWSSEELQKAIKETPEIFTSGLILFYKKKYSFSG